MFFVDKWVHSNSLINVQPEENCRIDENVQMLEAEKKSAWTGVDWVRFKKKFSKRQTLKLKNWRSVKSALGTRRLVLGARQNWRSALGARYLALGTRSSAKLKKKAPSAASVLKGFHDWSPGGRRCVLHFDGLPLTRGVVVATPFAAAVSLTFSLVKNLQMLLQAKRQPG